MRAMNLDLDYVRLRSSKDAHTLRRLALVRVKLDFIEENGNN